MGHSGTDLAGAGRSGGNGLAENLQGAHGARRGSYPRTPQTIKTPAGARHMTPTNEAHSFKAGLQPGRSGHVRRLRNLDR